MIMLEVIFFLNCELKIKKHNAILHHDIKLKQTRCICVSISSLFGDKTENINLL